MATESKEELKAGDQIKLADGVEGVSFGSVYIPGRTFGTRKVLRVNHLNESHGVKPGLYIQVEGFGIHSVHEDYFALA